MTLEKADHGALPDGRGFLGGDPGACRTEVGG